MSASKTVVIGRNNAKELDLGAIMRKLGGGGHPGAGSAILKASVEEVRTQVIQLIEQAEIKEQTVGLVMTPVKEYLSQESTLQDALAMMQAKGRQAALVVDENMKLLGIMEAKQFAKIRHEKQWHQPVTSMMRRQVTSVHPHQSVREALHLMSGSEIGFLPVVQDDVLKGQITRATIILNMYEF